MVHKKRNWRKAMAEQSKRHLGYVGYYTWLDIKNKTDTKKNYATWIRTVYSKKE
jgi:hypothetical protein